MLAERIREAREAIDLTQNDVAVRLKISIQSISSWENGKALPSFKNLEQLALLTNHDMDFFFMSDEKMNVNYSEDEEQIVSCFRLLNSIGRDHAMAVLKCLTLDADMLK